MSMQFGTIEVDAVDIPGLDVGAILSSRDVSIRASAPTVTPGERVWLTWTAPLGAVCAASGGWSGAKATFGVEVVGPLLENTTFRLTCAGESGPVSGHATVAVRPGGSSPPASGAGSEVTLASRERSVPLGGFASLHWSAPGAHSCFASGGWSGARPSVGSEHVGPMASDTTFTLMCSGTTGNVIAMTTVVVQQATLRWSAPTHDAEGASLELAGFRIHWGDAPGQYRDTIIIPDTQATAYQIPLPGSGMFYFSMSAYDAAGVDRLISNEVAKEIP